MMCPKAGIHVDVHWPEVAAVRTSSPIGALPRFCRQNPYPCDLWLHPAPARPQLPSMISPRPGVRQQPV